MKRLTIILVLVLMGSGVMAQKKNNAQEKIRAAKIALITERLGLTPDQAQRFWPLYNEFTSKRGELRKEFNTAKKGVDIETASEAESRKIMEMGLRLKQNELNLEKEYRTKMMDVISTKQILSLKNAEDDFRKMVFDRLKKQKMAEKRKQMMRDRYKDKVRDRVNN